jgi:hypothetical protein
MLSVTMRCAYLDAPGGIFQANRQGMSEKNIASANGLW